MTSVEKILDLCKRRKIPVSRLEKACGFSNGYLSNLKKGTLPDDRLRRVAKYLLVIPEYLATDEFYINGVLVDEEEYDSFDPRYNAMAVDKDMQYIWRFKKNFSPEVFANVLELMHSIERMSTTINANELP